ncbi:hypothetical protein ACSNOI_34240 [Actinomadura kijaniata]|uniref:hypothetical protein n=1 Tax=Actinomadura kijaniata TaxID=46161 RepID=UPI003F1DF50B
MLAAARQAADGPKHHFTAIQLPVSLVHLAPLAQALNEDSPIAQAAREELEVGASAPFNGGERPP